MRKWKKKNREENNESKELFTAIPLYSSQYGIIMIENIVGEDPNEIRRRFVPPKNNG